MHKKLILFILVLVLVFSLLPTKATEKTNLITSSTHLLGSDTASLVSGTYKQSNSSGEHFSLFKSPNLTNNFSFSADIKILEYGTDSQANGIRFTLGYDEINNNYLNLLLTRHPGVAIERKGHKAESDIYPLTTINLSGILDVGSEFKFEIRKQANHLRFTVNGQEVLTTSFPSDLDFFTPNSEANIGFYSANCSFEAKNLKLYNETDNIFEEKSLLDFSGFADGPLAKGIYNNWNIEWPSTNKSKIESGSGLTYLNVEGYFQGVFAFWPSEEYEINFNMLATKAGDNLAFFIRSARDRFLTRSPAAPSAEFFEADGADNLGGTGIYLKALHGDNKVALHIKQRDLASAKGLKSATLELDISHILGDLNQTSKIVNYKFIDKGSSIDLLIDNTLLAVIELSNETITYPDFMQQGGKKYSNDTYVKTVKVKANDGSLLLSVENSLVCAGYSIIGIGARNVGTLYLDDLSVNVMMATLEPETEVIPKTFDGSLLIYTIVFLVIGLVFLKKRRASNA